MMRKFQWFENLLKVVLVFLVLGPTSIEGVRHPVLACVYPSWSALRHGAARFSPEQLDPFLCTHVVYMYAQLDENELIISFGNPALDTSNNGGLDLYNRTTALKQKNPRLKVLLSIGGLFDSIGPMITSQENDESKYRRMLQNQQLRQNFIVNAVHFLQKHKFDGLNFHWEYPHFTDRDFLSAFIKECKKKFREDNLLLTLTMSAISSVAYDLPVISKYCDQIYLMTYDFHGFYEGKVHLISPLRLPFNTSFSIEGTVNQLLRNGVSSDKLVFGVATYAKSYELLDSERHDPGSPSNGPGIPGPYTDTAGYLAYYETCSDEWVKIDDETREVGPYAFYDDQWISFNDIQAVVAKTEFVLRKGARGVIFWSVDQDDFSGKFCGEGTFPLINAARFVIDKYVKESKAVANWGHHPFIPDRCNVMGVFPDPSNCHHFYHCMNGILRLRLCGEGLFWDQRCRCCVLSNNHC